MSGFESPDRQPFDVLFFDAEEMPMTSSEAKVRDADLETARGTVEEQMSSLGEGVLKRFPREYRERLDKGHGTRK